MLAAGAVVVGTPAAVVAVGSVADVVGAVDTGGADESPGSTAHPLMASEPTTTATTIAIAWRSSCFPPPVTSLLVAPAGAASTVATATATSGAAGVRDDGPVTPIEVPIRDESIRLGQLLQLAGVVDSGSDAKFVLAGGEVTVNGELETRRGRQVRPGDVVEALGAAVRVVGPADAG